MNGSDKCHPAGHLLCCARDGTGHLPLCAGHPVLQHPTHLPPQSRPSEEGGVYRPTRQKGKRGLQSSCQYAKIAHKLSVHAERHLRDLGGHCRTDVWSTIFVHNENLSLQIQFLTEKQSMKEKNPSHFLHSD